MNAWGSHCQPDVRKLFHTVLPFGYILGTRSLQEVERNRSPLPVRRRKAMMRTLLTLAAGIGVGVAGTTAAQQGAKGPAKTIAARDIVEKLDGKEAKATYVELTYE